MKNKKIDSFLKLEMTRKEFLQHIGVFALGVFGFFNFLQYIAKFSDQPKQAEHNGGFGTSRFGV